MTTEPQAQTSERERLIASLLDSALEKANDYDCESNVFDEEKAADMLRADAKQHDADAEKIRALEAALDFAQWSEAQVDAARGLLMYYLGGTQSKWSIRDHMRAGGYAIPLNEGENYNSLPKNLVVHLILRIAATQSPRSEAGEGKK